MSEALISLVVLVALLPITHDGQAYAPGERLSVTEAQAQPLIDCGAAELAPADEPTEADAGSGGGSAPASTRATSGSKKR